MGTGIQRSWEISILGDRVNLTGQFLEQLHQSSKLPQLWTGGWTTRLPEVPFKQQHLRQKSWDLRHHGSAMKFFLGVPRLLETGLSSGSCISNDRLPVTQSPCHPTDSHRSKPAWSFPQYLLSLTGSSNWYHFVHGAWSFTLSLPSLGQVLYLFCVKLNKPLLIWNIWGSRWGARLSEPSLFTSRL